MRKVDPAKHEEKRREILEAAERCFVRDGFRGASISDICGEAGISPGHLYHYFASKEAIIGAMTDAGLEYATSRLSKMMEESNAISALLSELGRGKSGHGHRPISQSFIFDMLAEAVRNPAIADIVREHSRALRTLLSAFLRDAQERGQVDGTLDADLTAAILMSVIDGAKSLAIRDPELDMTKGIDVLKTLISRFLTPPASGLAVKKTRR
jgi:TetR/AcrR family transcriptional regulator, repressor for uid operon